MYLRLLNPHREADVRLCAEVMARAPQYMLDTFGRMPTEADGAHLLNHRPDGARREDILVFAAIEYETTIGLLQVHLGFVHAHRANIGLLLVCPEHRRQGRGTAMLRQLSGLSAHWPAIQNFSASVLEGNQPALAFWRQAGFHVVGTGYTQPGYPHRMTVFEREVRPLLDAPMLDHPLRESAGVYSRSLYPH